MNMMMYCAKNRAELFEVMITRLDIQYNFKKGEYAATVWYTDGSVYEINEMGEMKKREA